MTNREFLNAVIANEISADVIAHAQAEIEKLNARNAKRAEKPSKKSVENEPIKVALIGLLTDEPQTASELAVKAEISVQKASALCRQIVADGNAKVVDVKVKGKGTQKGYTL